MREYSYGFLAQKQPNNNYYNYKPAEGGGGVWEQILFNPSTGAIESQNPKVYVGGTSDAPNTAQTLYKIVEPTDTTLSTPSAFDYDIVYPGYLINVGTAPANEYAQWKEDVAGQTTKSVDIAQANATIDIVDSAVQLNTTVLPATTQEPTFYRSDNLAVASVNQNGFVTYVGPGTCTITARSGQWQDTCTINVPVSGRYLTPQQTGDTGIAYSVQWDTAWDEIATYGNYSLIVRERAVAYNQPRLLEDKSYTNSNVRNSINAWYTGNSDNPAVALSGASKLRQYAVSSNAVITGIADKTGISTPNAGTEGATGNDVAFALSYGECKAYLANRELEDRGDLTKVNPTSKPATAHLTFLQRRTNDNVFWTRTMTAPGWNDDALGIQGGWVTYDWVATQDPIVPALWVRTDAFTWSTY